MSGKGLTAIKRLMNEYKGTLSAGAEVYADIAEEISVNPPEGIFAGNSAAAALWMAVMCRSRVRGQLFCMGGSDRVRRNSSQAHC